MTPGSTKGELPTEELLARAAAGLTGEEREAFLRLCCVGDPDLRAVISERLEGGTLIESTSATGGDGGGAGPGGGRGGRLRVPVEGEGSVIGPYRLLERVGEGGMGEVYRAEQSVPLRRVVAFKLLKLGLNSRLVVARFEAERQALALMDHPGIARVFDAGSTPLGRPYFVMEYVDGVPLTTHCDCDRLGLRERLRLFVEICRAVQHAHQKGIIHRDLKPSNILVAEAEGGGGSAVKVIDFGIAKATGGRLTDQTIATGYLQLLGTPAYMAPEQIGGMAADVDTRCDIYALGGVLYELLTGTTPIDATTLAGASPAELERILREEEPEAPSARVRGLGPVGAAVACYRGPGGARRLEGALKGDLDWITLKALAKERERRYGTADELAADVRRHLRHEPVLAGPPTARYRLGKFARRHRVPLVMGSLLLAALVAGLAASAWQAEKAIAAGATAVHARDRGEELIEFMLTDLEAKLSPVGRTELLEAVGDEVMEYYKEFDVATESPKALWARSEAFLRIAQVKSTKGALAEAEEVVERALEIRRALAEHDRGVAGERYRHGIALCLGRRGQVRRDRGNLERADADFAAAAAALRQTAGAGAAQGRKVDRVRTLNRWAEIRRERGGEDRGRGALEEARGVIEDLKASGFYTAAAEDEEARNWFEAAYDRRLQGDLAGSKGLYDRAVAVWRRRLESDPGNVVYQEALASGLENLGLIGVEQRDIDGGFAALEEAGGLRRALASLDPDNGTWQFKLAINRNAHAGVLIQMGDLDGAGEKLAEVAPAWERLIARDPSNAMAKEGHGVSHFYAGVIEMRQGRPAEARARLDLAEGIFGELIEGSGAPGGVTHRRWFAHRSAARAVGIQSFGLEGDPGAAAEGVREALEVRRELTRIDPGDLDARLGLALTYRVLADVESRRGNVPAMRGAIAEAITLMDALFEADPSNASWGDMMIETYKIAAELEGAAGAQDLALGFYRRGLDRAVEVAGWEAAGEYGAILLFTACVNLMNAPGTGPAERDRERVMAAARGAARMRPADEGIANLAADATYAVVDAAVGRGEGDRGIKVLQDLIQEWGAPGPPRPEAIRQRVLAEAHGILGFRLKAAGRADEARGHFAQSLRLSQLRAGREPDAETKAILFAAHHNYGVSLWEDGDIEGAIEHYRAAIGLEGATRERVFLVGRVDLAQLYDQLADRCAAAGDAAGAWAARLEVARVRAEVFDLEEGSSDLSWDLAATYRKLAEFGRVNGREAEALTAARLALGVLRPLAEGGDGAAEDLMLKLAALFEISPGLSAGGREPALAAGSTWRYYSAREGPGPGWTEAGFDDSGWAEGRAQLGYGDGDEATEIPFGPEAGDKFITAYFRRTFELPVAAPPGGGGGAARWRLRVLCDDGAAVYLNGEEVGRVNLPPGPPGAETLATTVVADEAETLWHPLELPRGALRAGTNTIAVEVHQHGGGSSDLSFDLEVSSPPGAGLENLLAAATRFGLPVPVSLGQ